MMNNRNRYHDRYDAGCQLARCLKKYQNQADAIVLALPRGGVPVAYEVADYLQLPLDVFVVRKLGVPLQPELAMGAIASGDTCVLNQDLITSLGLSQEAVNQVIEAERTELARRESTYRAGRAMPDLTHKTIMLIDDGIATGASTKAAISAIGALSPGKLILAVPAAPASAQHELSSLVDAFVCLQSDADFSSVGQYYDDFSQTQDSEVEQLLKKNRVQRKGR